MKDLMKTAIGFQLFFSDVCGLSYDCGSYALWGRWNSTRGLLFYFDFSYSTFHRDHPTGISDLCSALSQNALANTRKLLGYTFPIWMYIAITGVIVYMMISPYYV